MSTQTPAGSRRASVLKGERGSIYDGPSRACPPCGGDPKDGDLWSAAPGRACGAAVRRVPRAMRSLRDWGVGRGGPDWCTVCRTVGRRLPPQRGSSRSVARSVHRIPHTPPPIFTRLGTFCEDSMKRAGTALAAPAIFTYRALPASSASPACPPWGPGHLWRCRFGSDRRRGRSPAGHGPGFCASVCSLCS